MQKVEIQELVNLSDEIEVRIVARKSSPRLTLPELEAYVIDLESKSYLGHKMAEANDKLIKHVRNLIAELEEE